MPEHDRDLPRLLEYDAINLRIVRFYKCDGIAQRMIDTHRTTAPWIMATPSAGIPWYGLHAFRRGLATNLHELGVADIVIQAILRHSNVSVTRAAYIKNDSVDPQSLAAMQVLESAVSNHHAGGESQASGDVQSRS